MLGILTIFTGLTTLYFLSFLYKFCRNYVVASKTGLPVLVLPVDQNHFVWMILSVPLRPILRKCLPTSWFDRINLSIYGWEHHSKLLPFNTPAGSSVKQKTADGQNAVNDKTIMLSGCGRLEFWTANAAVSREILSRPRDFQQFEIVDLFVSIFGPNVLSTNGDVWAKHRRIVATAVTERISPVTWAESVRQTEGLLAEVCGQKGGQHGETTRIFDMMKKVTIHVLSGAGMGIMREWTPKPKESTLDDSDATTDLSKPKEGYKLSYQEAVELINKNMVGPNVVPVPVLRNWPFFLPNYQTMRRLGQAKVEFPLYTKEMLNKEKQRNAEASKGSESQVRNNIMSMLIAASDSNPDDQPNEKGPARKGPALTDDELVSNLYIFTAAGFDSTSNSLSYALTLLMRYPRWQEWMMEEIDVLVANAADLSDYQAIFPKCTRVLAVMFETLRLFPPLSHEVKMTKTAQTLSLENGRQVLIPPTTTVYVNNVGLHLDPSVWRDLNPDDDVVTDTDDEAWEDAMPGRNAATPADRASNGGQRLGDEWRFRPTRWITGTATAETLFQPPRGTFLPWSMGPRVCPGQRMAQVEFTAIFVALFSRYRIDAVRRAGETATQLHARMDTLMQDSTSKLTLEMDVYEMDESDEARGLKVRLTRRG